MKGIINMRNEKIIRVFHTHIEVTPYELGENPAVEKMASIWLKAEYRYDPVGYFIYNDTLYLPRGFNVYALEKQFDSKAYVMSTYMPFNKIKKAKMTKPPRDDIQKAAIDFLTANGKYKDNVGYSQLGLLLDTGEGKTYSTVHSLIKLGMKAIIITHMSKIRNQWMNTFHEMTTVNPNRILMISGPNEAIKLTMSNDAKNYDFFFVNHRTLMLYAREYGVDGLREFFEALGVGVKVYDECHTEFHNILMVDAFTNVYKTIYLTATFEESDMAREKLFKRALSSIRPFSSNTDEFNKNKRKHIIYAPVTFNSNPSVFEQTKAATPRGLSITIFSRYSFPDGYSKMKDVFYEIFHLAFQLEGKILITVPLIEQTHMVKNIVENMQIVKDKKPIVGIINSEFSESENEETKVKCDIIITTIRSCGVGLDIKGLRSIINMQPFSSKVTGKQLIGRLREYAPDKNTYFFDIIDVGFDSCRNQFKQKTEMRSYIRYKCKEIRHMPID